MKCGSRAMRATRSSGHIRDQNVLLGFSLHRDHTQSHTAHSHTRLLETADRHRGVGGAQRSPHRCTVLGRQNHYVLARTARHASDIPLTPHLRC